MKWIDKQTLNEEVTLNLIGSGLSVQSCESRSGLNSLRLPQRSLRLRADPLFGINRRRDAENAEQTQRRIFKLRHPKLGPYEIEVAFRRPEPHGQFQQTAAPSQ